MKRIGSTKLQNHKKTYMIENGALLRLRRSWSFSCHIPVLSLKIWLHIKKMKSQYLTHNRPRGRNLKTLKIYLRGFNTTARSTKPKGGNYKRFSCLTSINRQSASSKPVGHSEAVSRDRQSFPICQELLRGLKKHLWQSKIDTMLETRGDLL